MYTNEEKAIAKKLCDNEEYLDLLAKVFLETEDKLTHETVTGKTNVELGEIVRADTMAEMKIASRFNSLKLLGQSLTESTKKSAVKS